MLGLSVGERNSSDGLFRNSSVGERNSSDGAMVVISQPERWDWRKTKKFGHPLRRRSDINEPGMSIGVSSCETIKKTLGSGLDVASIMRWG